MEPLEFAEGPIDGVSIRLLDRFPDERGWLIECYRNDELDLDLTPVMAYVSLTHPGVVRGPHEHVDQVDNFAFIGPSEFKVYLWDARDNSPTRGSRMVVVAGVDNPSSIIVPPGVVHAYKNVGREEGLVFNAPNRLYAGEGKSEPVDEIRHEDDPDSPYAIDS